MKKAIVFVVCLLVAVFAAVAVLLLDFKTIFAAASAPKPDDWMILQYICTDNDGNQIEEQTLFTKEVPLYLNKTTGKNETKEKNVRLEKGSIFSNPGNDFASWWIGGKKYEAEAWLPGGLSDKYLEVTCTWTPKLYQITFDPMGGTPTPTRVSVRFSDTYGQAISANSHMTKANCDFAGWWTSPTGGTRVLSTDTVKITENKTLYARWIPHGGTGETTYFINFYRNGGTGGFMDFQSAEAGTSVTLNKNTFTRTNYKFDGWATTERGGVKYADQATIQSLDGNMDLYAVWSPVPIDQCTITYNANGGDAAAPSSSTVTKNSIIVLPNYTGIKAGCKFVGWALNAEGAGTVYAVGSNYAVDATRTLYAKWEANKYMVSFDGNGATNCLMDDQEHTYGTSLALSKNEFEVTGHTFAGWATDPIGSVVYADCESVINLTDVDGGVVRLYAIYEAHKFTIHFDGNGATSGSMDDAEYTYGSGIMPSLHRFVRDGYTLIGWALNAEGTGTIYVDYIVTEDATLYAIWTENKYTVHFYGNGATSGSMDDQDHTYDASLALSENEFKKTGYTFAGWATSSLGCVKYADFESVLNLTNEDGAIVKLFAKWTANKYMVRFDGNGAESGSMDDQEHTYGTSLELSLNEYVREGYSFIGWATSPSGIIAYGDGLPVLNLTDKNGEVVKIFAQWKKDPVSVTVSFNSNGGSEVTPKAVVVGEEYGELETPTKPGYKFDGWYINGDLITSETIVTIESGHALEASWSSYDLTYTFDYDGGKATPDVLGGGAGYIGSVSFPTVEKAGYTLLYWTSTGAPGVQFAADLKFAYAKDLAPNLATGDVTITIIAVWQKDPVSVTVSFNSNGGSDVTPKTVTVGEKYGELETPTRPGYKFDGWYLDGNLITSETIVTVESNHTLSAKLTPYEVSITWDYDGGSVPGSYLSGSMYESSVSFPTEITKAGYTFLYWTSTGAPGEQFTGSFQPTKDLAPALANGNVSITIKAVWQKDEVIPVYVTVSFESNGGTSVDPMTLEVGKKYPSNSVIGIPYKAGYTFVGWFTESGEKVTTSMIVSEGDHTLYAHWTGNSITVSFNSAGGTATESIVVVVGETYGKLGTPVRPGWTFDGWYDAQGNKITSDTIVTATSNQTLTARWK